MPIFEVEVDVTYAACIKVEAPNPETAKRRAVYAVGSDLCYDQDYAGAEAVGVEDVGADTSVPFHLPEQKWQESYAEVYGQDSPSDPTNLQSKEPMSGTNTVHLKSRTHTYVVDAGDTDVPFAVLEARVTALPGVVDIEANLADLGYTLVIDMSFWADEHQLTEKLAQLLSGPAVSQERQELPDADEC